MKMCHIYSQLSILCIVLSCVTSAAEVVHVSGYIGSQAKVSCSYPEGYETYMKYLCRDPCDDADVLIESTATQKNRYSISDDNGKRVFTTTISDLSKTDAGKYWCGVSRTGQDIYTEVQLDLVPDSCCNNVEKIQSYDGGSVSISCPYESANQNNLKYICRGNQPSNCLQQAVVTSNTKQNGRYKFTEETASRKFTVTITSLSLRDSGSYLCGVKRNTGLDVFSAVELDVKENRCCDSSTKIQSYDGGSVSISCPYESANQNNLKYICRGNQPSNCLQQAVVTSNTKQNGRYKFTEETVSRKFTVTITSLSLRDSGSYLCGVKRNTGLDVFTAVELKVRENRCCDSSTKIQSYDGGSVSISCPYESANQNNLKYICRGNQPSNCLQQAVVTSNTKQNGRYKFTEETVSRKFTVTITSLSLRDSGSYLCGVKRNTGLDVFSAVELDVKEWCCVKSNQLSGTVGQPVSLQCPYPPQHQTNRKFLCKGAHHKSCSDVVTGQSRFTLRDNASSSSFLVTITKMEEGDAGTYWCGSDPQWTVGNYTKIELSVDKTMFPFVVYIVSAVLVLVLLAAVFIIYKYRCNKVPASAAGGDRNRAITMAAAEPDDMVYQNEEVISSKQKNMELQNYYADEDQQDAVYENFATSEDVYCNEFNIQVHKK
ncbi:polymeric immunoglobulin receptor-like isoform X2 [Mastacembelus armatus]|uniref:polymeric immunoglobulin receptor-like isoform X2 n=1 Tax=Mastacembelus armatus TaxID=205130 RepID=UPI000E45A897|nr:polymeric immunoglobulin receptor-like isoform X2 [Mastacembelus armatus]